MEPVRAGAWIRVSTGGQDEANQVPDIERYCADRYYQIRTRYVLHDKSASKGEQQAELDRMLADMRSGHIQVLVAWHSWRLERRGPAETFGLLKAAGDAGGRIESVQESWFGKAGDASSDIMTAVHAVMGEQYSKNVVAGTQLAYTRIDGNGAFRWKVPFGYAAKGPKYNKHLVPTEIGREFVPQIFDRIIDGDSLSAVCAWLDSLKVRLYPHDVYHPDDKDKPDTGKRVIHREGDPMPWWPATVMALIRNPVYIGHYAKDDGTGQDRTWIHECEPVVDATIFRLANEALSDRARRQRGPRGRPENRAMLKSAIRCPVCGVPMHKNASPNTRTSGGGVSKPYYRCRAQGPPADLRGGCGNNVSMALVDETVNKIMAVTWRRPVMLATLIRGTDYQPELDAIAGELRQLPQRGLDRRAEQAERERLWAEEDRIRALPVTDDRWAEVATGELYSELYEAQPVSERGAWLHRHGFTVYADKAEVTLTRRSPDGTEVTWTEPLPSPAR
jgi:DNA invertase Pin-like site-specific DNA recombinase